MYRKPSGIHLLKKISQKVGDHYGVGLSGWWAVRFGSVSPIVVHLHPSGLTISAWDETWQAIGRAADAEAALRRLQEARSGAYHFFNRNCEHFARYVVTARRESRQLQGAALLIGLTILLLTAQD